MNEKLYKLLSYSEFMSGMMNAPWDYNKCKDCGGRGLKAVMCCNGDECSCMALPHDFVECECGIEEPTDDQIRKWLNK